ncbi:MAG: carbamate kinase [Gammaproteobacteria bacterium]|jgi:carbamate kinase|nr:carbamate kinase [Gammaproteobacteria bacterium]
MNAAQVISLGGNAFAGANESMSMMGQFDFAARTLAPLADLLAQTTPLLITHGNGPQVGYILTRVEEAIGKAYELPLEVCVAESEGEIGYVLQQTLHNLVEGRRPVATLLTQVLVDEGDPAFADPSKPIGPWFEGEQANALERAGMALVRDPAGRARRVVPSPQPRRIIEIDIIRRMLDLGVVVIAAGGGGIPVVEHDGQLRGVEAVVDKDLATAMLAIEIGAESLVLVTGVEGVYTEFGSARAQLLRRATVEQLRTLAAEGHFPPGSMGPKVEAAAAFAERTGRPAIICQPADLPAALAGGAGTQISRE